MDQEHSMMHQKRAKTMQKTPLVLDLCCGSKQFYPDKSTGYVIFCDIRKGHFVATDGHKMRPVDVRPDILADFCRLPFKDESFDLCVFDPPHLIKAGSGSWLAKKYGTLSKKADLKEGFSEAWRVLKVGGTLLFKWSEHDIAFREIKPFFPAPPLITDRDHRWTTFFKTVSCASDEAIFLKFFSEIKDLSILEATAFLKQNGFKGSRNKVARLKQNWIAA